MVAEKVNDWMFFCNGYNELAFFVMGQIGLKFGQCYSSLKGVIFPKPPFFVASTGLHVTGLQVRGYVF